jgi:hypothetical protein
VREQVAEVNALSAEDPVHAAHRTFTYYPAATALARGSSLEPDL